MMGKTIKLVIFLAIVSGLSGLTLALVNSQTAPIIEAAKVAAVKSSLEEIYPGTEFAEIEAEVSDVIGNVYEVKQSGSTAGYVYKATVTGYGGDVIFLVGINTDGSYKGFKAVTYDQETSGFGQRIGTEEYESKYDGKKVDDNIDTLAGATITSTAVKKGVSEVVEHYKANYK